ncbi:MAG TPA: hypothetical protein VFH63_06425 [candidate division Zixibacteria bacterium]|nr:hypothetical protein [candidate division Zixibacteria bacterium]
MAVLVALAGCGPSGFEALVAEYDLRGEAVVRLGPDYAVAARALPGGAEVIGFLRQENGEWTAQQLASSELAGPNGVQMVSYGGETGEEWNTFVYGVAAREVSRVVLEGRLGEGGQVIGGAWVVALRERDLGPRDIHWRFLSARGGVLASGSGITP